MIFKHVIKNNFYNYSSSYLFSYSIIAYALIYSHFKTAIIVISVLSGDSEEDETVTLHPKQVPKPSSKKGMYKTINKINKIGT
jgi:hypothetical protein